ncbi:hypothetical protein RHMOL_Rhmol08G0134900 [Rhododendron molle]|uniref:Uncharacterized protein n=1 Tax=Rhododendron molle TaxID=49168 RepID=A0ACC0MNP5_RHOML|nr:hypothetical protein RHMOL_Rhmol08G0134900 [Rhododendron molle]
MQKKVLKITEYKAMEKISTTMAFFLSLKVTTMPAPTAIQSTSRWISSIGYGIVPSRIFLDDALAFPLGDAYLLRAHLIEIGDETMLALAAHLIRIGDELTTQQQGIPRRERQCVIEEDYERDSAVAHG